MQKDSGLNTVTEKDELDVLSLVKMFWFKKGTAIAIVGIFVLFGLFIAVFSANEFTARSIFIPHTSEGAGAGMNLGGLASLAGISLGQELNGAEIPPILYPKLIGSYPFKKEMLKAPININGVEDTLTYQGYYEEYYEPGLLTYLKNFTFGLPGLIIKSLKGEVSEDSLSRSGTDLIALTPHQVEHFDRLGEQIAITFNSKEGFVELSVAMPEPVAAAQMAKYAAELLQKEVIAYKIKNASEQLRFTEERYLEKKMEFEEIQTRLARFRDRNQNISSSMALNELEKLEAEYNLEFSVYNELAKQLEQSKLQVSKNTPIFSVIQPVLVPTEKSAPNRLVILILFFILGVIAAIGVIFGSILFKRLRELWQEDSILSEHKIKL